MATRPQLGDPKSGRVVFVTKTRGTDSGPASSLIGPTFGLLTEDGNSFPSGPEFNILTEDGRFLTTEQGL